MSIETSAAFIAAVQGLVPVEEVGNRPPEVEKEIFQN
jgi:hypothetical protein